MSSVWLLQAASSSDNAANQWCGALRRRLGGAGRPGCDWGIRAVTTRLEGSPQLRPPSLSISGGGHDGTSGRCTREASLQQPLRELDVANAGGLI